MFENMSLLVVKSMDYTVNYEENKEGSISILYIDFSIVFFVTYPFIHSKEKCIKYKDCSEM